MFAALMQPMQNFREDWMPMSIYPPMPCEVYEVTLADRSVHRAFWSGKSWWLQGKPVVPAKWRPLADGLAA